MTLEVPVLIVGAGPVGVTAAILLEKLGVESLVVERRDGPHQAPQAHVVNPRSLEILRAGGVDVGEIQARATPIQDAMGVLWMTTLAGEVIGRLRFELQAPDMVASTPTPLLNISQNLLEPILIEHLRKRGGADLRFGHEWVSSEQDEGGVTSRVRANGAEIVVRSRAVIAADGAGSRVRKSLGIEMQGPDRLQSFVMIHCEGSLREIVKEYPGILYWIVDPECRGVLIAHDIDRSWVYMHPYDPDTEKHEDFTENVCTGIVRRAIGSGAPDFAIRDVSTWTMTAQIAERYGEGRIFLAGDSAHRFPPTGGIGMNTGIADAQNLAWKLFAVESGWASDSLLASYERERRPVAQENSDQSLKNAFKMIEVAQALGITEDNDASRRSLEATLADPAGRERVGAAIEGQREHFDMLALHLGYSYEDGAVVPDGSERPRGESLVSDYVPTTRPGSRLPHAWVVRAGALVSTLDLVRDDCFTLIAGEDGAAWQRAAADASVPVTAISIGGDDADVGDPNGAWAAIREIGPDGALLVRPDQHVAWRVAALPADPAAALGEALSRLLR